MLLTLVVSVFVGGHGGSLDACALSGVELRWVIDKGMVGLEEV